MKFDHDRLRRALKGKREREGLTLRDVQIETGISRSTLSRFERAVGVVDVDTAARLAEFIGLQLSALSAEAGAVTVECGDTLGAVRKLLASDPALKDSDADGLMTIMRTAYRRAVEK